MIAQSAMGVEIRRSNVRILVSHGAMIGPIDEAVTKSAIPQRLGTKNIKENFFPKQNATNRKDGIKIPDISTGLFR